MDREPVVRLVDLRTGVRVAFAEQGDRAGPAVLLLHAWGESLRSFDRLVPLLPASLHVLAMDQRGHGQADAPEDGYDLESLARDVEAFLDEVGLPSAVLVGSSSGGYVAQQVAVRSPDRVAGLVLLGSPASLRGRPAFADEVDGLTDPIDPGWVRDSSRRSRASTRCRTGISTTGSRSRLASPPASGGRACCGLITSPAPIETGPISAPTLIVWGDRDEVLPYEGQLALAAAIPGSTLRTYEGVGHLVLWEQPERVAADLVDFVLASPR